MVYQLYTIQLVQGAGYALRARQVRSESVPLEEFRRGEITDRNGIPLSGGYYANRVVVFPGLMEQKEYSLQRLAGIINDNPGDLLEKARHGAFVIDRPLSDQECRALQKAGLPGVFLLPVYHRYGSDPLAVHITGHLGKISSMEQFDRLQRQSDKQYRLGDWVGKSGLEYFYEQELKGTFAKRWARVPVDARGKVIKGPGLLVESKGRDPGRRHVVTTVDFRVQRIVEQVMDQHVQNGAVVVMRAGSGDILAMASRPEYHPAPGRVQSGTSSPAAEAFVNHCTSLYQPGSVFKVVLAAAALEKGLVDGSDEFVCEGVNAKPIRCWHEEGHGRISFAEAFACSCNPAFVEIGRRLGADTIVEYAGKMGLASQAIIGYPVPAGSGQDWSLVGKKYNLANSCVGQGPVLATPVQVTAMLNVVASGGVYYTPRLVKGIKDDDGCQVKSFDGPPPQRVLAPQTAAQLRDLLRSVTASGVGRLAEVPAWGSAGKTGSAQVAAGSGAVDAWFAGYVPAEGPRYVITVLVRNGRSGGATAAPLFREIAGRIMEASGAGF